MNYQELLPKKPRLFGSSVKTEKGQKYGVDTAILYLAPANYSVPLGGMEVCAPSASTRCSCRKGCLGTISGRLTMSSARKAQIWKTLLLTQDPQLFWDMAANEIWNHERLCHRKGKIPAVRLNGSSDLPLSCTVNLAAQFPKVHFYDYTKRLSSILYLALRRDRNPTDKAYSLQNVDLTFSWSRAHNHKALHAIAKGFNVAVVFEKTIPETFLGWPVIDGDVSDVRFVDPVPCIVGLRWKGSRKYLEAQRNAENPFVVFQD